MSDAARHVRAGRLAAALGRRGEAIGHYEEALRADPSDEQVRFELANLLSAEDRFVDAAEHLERIVARNPRASGALGNLAKCLLRLGRAADCVVAAKRAHAASGDREHWTLALLASNHASGIPEEEIARDHREYARLIPSAAPWNPPPPRAGDIRVGFLSCDLRRHPVATFLEPLLAPLASDGVECHAFSSNAFEDDVTARLRPLFRSWSSIAAIDDARALDLIRGRRLDLLVDLGGHTAGHRLPLLARRAAPVQIAWLGYPNTTGVPAMDWRIVDEITDPPGSEALCSEQLLRVRPPFLCYAPASTPVGLERVPGPSTFISLNNPAKLSEHAVRLWSRVLLAAPRARLILRLIGALDARVVEVVTDRFEAVGVDRDRLEFDPWTPSHGAHLDVYRRADVALDPFPYHGTTTTCEALACGVPVVTRLGQAHRSRVGATLLSAVGLPDLIAVDDDAFVEKAASLGSDPSRLACIRQSLPERVRKGPLGDAAGLAASLAQAFRYAAERGPRQPSDERRRTATIPEQS